MRSRKFVTGTVLVLLACALPVIAHHSVSAEFDFNKTIDVTGAIARIEWGNPHVYVEVDSKDPASGGTARWRLQMAAPVCMEKHGISRVTMTVGSTITVRDAPRAKDGSLTIPVFTMIYENKSIRVVRAPSDPPVSSVSPTASDIEKNALSWCAP
jgi:hypothetical protein